MPPHPSTHPFHHTHTQDGRLVNFDTDTTEREAEPIAEWVQEHIDNYVTEYTEQPLLAALDTRQPMLVAYSAGAWCPPCVAMKKRLKEVATRVYPLQVAYVNCDDSRPLCIDKMGLEGYPAVFLHPNKDGVRKAALKMEGMPDADGLVHWVKSNLVGYKFTAPPP